MQIGTYAKYNNGSIFGKWFDLSDFTDKDDFMTACAELHKDEEDPEFMFQDWENIPDDLICESWLCNNFFEVKITNYINTSQYIYDIVTLIAIDIAKEIKIEKFLIFLLPLVKKMNKPEVRSTLLRITRGIVHVA